MRRSPRVYMSVEVDLDEVEIKDIIEYLKECGYAVIAGDGGKGFDLDALSEIHEAVRTGRSTDALSLLERIIRPKWKTPADCQKQLDALLGLAKPA